MVDTVVLKDEGNIIEVVQGKDLTVCKIVKSDVEIEDIRFVQLDDTPSSYEGSAGKTLVVNDDETALVFTRLPSTFISLTDTPTNYSNASGKLLVVNQQGTGISFVTYNSSDINIEYFTQLADVPNSYVDKAGQILTVKSTEDGLDMASFEDIMPNQSITSGSYNYPQIVVNAKGVITAIQEGSPFTFPPFTDKAILVGDGTTTPSTINVGNINQVMMVNNTTTPSWQFLQSLFDSYGNSTILTTSSSNINTSCLKINTNSSGIKINQESSSDYLYLGYDNDIQINGSGVLINKNLTMATTKEIIGSDGLSLNPNSATVSVSSSIDPATYSSRIINGNDLVTKKYYDDNQTNMGGVCKKTSVISITSNTANFVIPMNAIITDVYINITQAFNTESTISIEDSYSQPIYNSDDSPALSSIDLINIKTNIISLANDYQINVSIDNYTFGSANVFLVYFLA